MRGILNQSGKATPSKYDHEKNSKINKMIQQGLRNLVNNNMGLQSVLRNDTMHIIDRTLLNDIEDKQENLYNQSDSKSSLSETNSLRTYVSSCCSNCLSKQSNNNNNNNNDVVSTIHNIEDFTQKYFKELKNTLKNCILTNKPQVKFNEIAGNHYAKKLIHEAFVLPNLVPEFFTGKPKPWNKILLYGPPGVGKTMLAQAVCNEINATIFWVSLADITSKFIGESEKLLRMLFDMAREHSPSIIILDEMDSIGRKRNGNESETERRIKTEFLRQLDEVSNTTDRVYVLATTNMPWEFDIAALKRFERRIYLPMPDLKAREEIFYLHSGENHSLTKEDFRKLAELTDGYTGCDIANVINDAFMRPVRLLQQTTHYKLVKNTKSKLIKKSIPLTNINNFIRHDNLDLHTNTNNTTTMTTITTTTTIANKQILTKKAEEVNQNDFKNNNGNNFNNHDDEDDDDDDDKAFCYLPCNENELGAIKKSLKEIPPNRLLLPQVTLKDFKESIKNCKPTVHHSLLELYHKFWMKYGHTEQKADIPTNYNDYKTYFLQTKTMVLLGAKGF